MLVMFAVGRRGPLRLCSPTRGDAGPAASLVLAAAVVVCCEARTAPASKCGVSETFDDEGRVVRGLSPVAVCGAMMSTNCSESYASLSCPRGCPYLAPSRSSSCFFRCVPESDCASVNPELAFPDPATRVCSRCMVDSCRHCSGSEVCLECHAHFRLREAGRRCAFVLDSDGQDDLMLTVQVIVALVLVLLCFACYHLYRFGLHKNWRENREAICKALAHRHMVKVQDWNYGKAAKAAKLHEWYPLSVNLHVRDILGVGLCLFYNSICFIAGIATLFFVVTWWVWTRSDIQWTLDSLNQRSQVVEGVVAADAVAQAPLAVCGTSATDDVLGAMRSFAATNVWAIGFLYVASFIFSLAYGKYQKEHAKWYDSQNASMADYALCLKGLPRDATDEWRLQEWLQREFAAFVPPEQAAGTAHPVEVVGVSVCYDYTHCPDFVVKATSYLSEHLAAEESERPRCDAPDFAKEVTDEDGADARMRPEFSSADTDSKSDADVGGVSASAAVYVASTGEDEDESSPFLSADGGVRRAVEALFEGPDKLQGCGSAFLVFRHGGASNRVMNAYEKHRHLLRYPSAPDKPLDLIRVFSEPPTVTWSNMGISRLTRQRQVVKAFIKIFALIAAVQYFIMQTFVKYVVLPYAKTGAVAGSQKMVLAGIILGNVNMWLCITIYGTASGLGFPERDKMDVAIFCANVALSLINTCINVYSTFYTVYARESAQASLGTFLTMNSLVAMRTENAWAESLYFMMVPGMTYVGYLMCPLMAGMIPYCQNLLFMHLIYVWGCLPRGLLRLIKVFLPWAPNSLDVYSPHRAEKGLEPMEIGLPWDYSSNIVLPSMCFSMLFFASPFVWRTFLAMLGWACFYYCWCRYMHLRLMKACFYSTSRLDATVNYAWGLPLSIVAAAWCVWVLRWSGSVGESLPVWMRLAFVAVGFGASLAAWVYCYTRFVDPLHPEHAEQMQSKSVEEVAADRLYTWFNCNPIYVLKCAYYFRDSSGADIAERRHGHPLACGSDERDVRAYEIGKEYKLFSLAERQRLAAAVASSGFGEAGCNNPLEFETILELAALWLRRNVCGVSGSGASISPLRGNTAKAPLPAGGDSAAGALLADDDL